MSSPDYWSRRAALLQFDRMEGAEEISAEIAELYRTAYNQISHDLRGIFAEYAEHFALSDKEAMRLLNAMTDPGDLAELKRKLKAGGGEGAKDILAKLDAPETQRKLARLQALQDKINDISRDLYKQDLTRQKQWYTGLCHDTYYQTMHAVQREVGFQFSFAHIDDKLIRRVMASDWTGTGATFSERIWSNVDGVRKEVRKQLTWGLISGKTEKQMAKEIANKYAAGAFESRRLVRTESCYLSNEIQMETYKECGATRYMYVATLDTRTDEECGKLDRKIFPVSQKRPGINCPPMHPFCRCTTKIYIDQNTRDGLKRRARDPKTNRNVIIPASVSYTEWAKQNHVTPKKSR